LERGEAFVYWREILWHCRFGIKRSIEFAIRDSCLISIGSRHRVSQH